MSFYIVTDRFFLTSNRYKLIFLISVKHQRFRYGSAGKAKYFLPFLPAYKETSTWRRLAWAFWALAWIFFLFSPKLTDPSSGTIKDTLVISRLQ